MKNNSFNSSFPSRSNSEFTRRRKKRRFWFIMIIIAIVGYFAVPKILELMPKEDKIVEPGEPIPSETIIKTIPLPDIKSLRGL
ncbi:MAG: hypothetical protein KAH77_10035 [Thiomargarita sp.]|nr:hypothetical protein [Thiomargarita sp.]